MTKGQGDTPEHGFAGTEFRRQRDIVAGDAATTGTEKLRPWSFDHLGSKKTVQSEQDDQPLVEHRRTPFGDGIPFRGGTVDEV
jgi:hypothetical protein